MAAIVAVLHATTSALAPCATRKAAIASERSATTCSDLSPYGTKPESAKYSKCSCGSTARMWRSTDSPPTPESNTAIGALFVMPICRAPG